MRHTGHFTVLAAALMLTLGTSAPALADREAGSIPTDVCPAEDLVAGMTPEQARGTTFVGAYLGDAARSDGMTTSWRIERVYAGGPIPEDLVFHTPTCEWTNLTPGVRYLFSTAATDLDVLTDEPQTPSVTDSLAWEVLDDGSVRLAPFDTYDIDDYASPGLHAITTLEEALSGVAPGAGEGREPAPPTDLGFGCAGPDATPPLSNAVGTTFVGRYIGDEVMPGPLSGVRTYWSVERVYAGGPLPEILTMRSTQCGVPLLTPGKRYLFSTGNDLLMPSSWNTLAWRLGKDGSATLQPFRPWAKDDYAKTIRRLDTFEEALAALAPDAGERETPIRSADRTPG
jgi:hypothetical protein